VKDLHKLERLENDYVEDMEPARGLSGHWVVQLNFGRKYYFMAFWNQEMQLEKEECREHF